jgi:hypothetical protein
LRSRLPFREPSAKDGASTRDNCPSSRACPYSKGICVSYC